MGGGLEADLSPGAVPMLCSEPPTAAVWRPVLQVADVTHMHVRDGTGLQPAPARYHLLISDGVHSQHAILAPSLCHLASGGALRRGSVVRLLGYASAPAPAPAPGHARTILIFELKILQMECALIGSLKLYEPTKNPGAFSTSRSMSDGLTSDRKPFLGVTQVGPSCGSFPSGGNKLSSIAISEKPPVWKLVGQIKDENLGPSDKPDIITVKATILCVTELRCCVACPLVDNGKQCNGKATGDVDGTWRCDRCGYWFLETDKYGSSVRIHFQDHTGTASATAYEDVVEEILGCRAKDLYSMKYKEDDYEQLDDIIRRAVGKQYVFQLKVEWQLLSVKCTVLKAEKVNPSAESRRLLGEIDKLLQEGSGPGSELRSPTMPTYTGLLGSRGCSSTWQSSNSAYSGYKGSQLRAPLVQQRLALSALQQHRLFQ